MKAVTHDRYGSPDRVLQLREVDRPSVGDGDVLVRVRAASVHPDVWHVVTGLPYVLRLMGNGVRVPKYRVPGSDLAGVVEAVGRGVARFKPGDEVFGESVDFGWKNGGTFAEYAAVSQRRLALKPANVTFEQAACVPTSGYIAFTNLRGATHLAGRRVLINGAGGCVGSLAVQIAKAAGAEVTAVDCGERLAMLRHLGADHVIDYQLDDFLHTGERYDVILDVATNLWFDVCAPALAAGGEYVPIGHAHFGKATGRMKGKVVGMLPAFMSLLLKALINPKHGRRFKIPGKPEVMAALTKLVASGQITSIVARTFPLSDAAAALWCLEHERVPGRIVITP